MGSSRGAHGISAADRDHDGWTRRFTAVGRRLDEMAALYRALGYEVRVEPEDTAQGTSSDACERCVVLTLTRTIYTRRPGATAAPGDGV